MKAAKDFIETTSPSPAMWEQLEMSSAAGLEGPSIR